MILTVRVNQYVAQIKVLTCENQITVKPIEGNQHPEGTWNYSFSNDDKTLTVNNVSGGTTGVYTKQ